MQFRPYQTDYINSIKLNQSNLLVSPMRSGKSLIMKGIIDTYFQGKFVLIIVGMRNVILQLSSYYDDYTFILAGKDFDHSKHIQLATFQTFGRRSIDLSQYDAIFVDEAHMRFNTDLVKQIRELTCTRVFFTGTPLFTNNKLMHPHVDNTLQFITVEEMINDGYLAPTRFMAIGNILKDESELSTQNGDYLNEDIDRIIDKQALIEWIVRDNQTYGWSTNHKTIMYTNSIATSERIVAAFNDPANVRLIHSKLTSKQIDDVMEWFNSTHSGIIVNCRMLTVGVDIPSADTVVYLLPTKIYSLFLQSIFRASTLYGNKIATVYDYSGMLGKVNPYTDFSNYSKKLSCKDECIKQFPNDPLAQYFCLESCTSNPILVHCSGELPSSYADNPIVSNFHIHEGTPCLEAHPVYRMQYKQTEPSAGIIRKWCKCPCGCITSYDVKTLTEPADMILMYSDTKNLNTVTVLFSEEHRKALALFDDPKQSHYQVIMFTSSADLYKHAVQFFNNKPFQVLSNAQMNLPNIAIDSGLTSALPLVNWHSEDNSGFIRKLIHVKFSAVCADQAIKPGYVYFNMQHVTPDNEKQVLQFLNLKWLDRSKIVKFFKKLGESNANY